MQLLVFLIAYPLLMAVSLLPYPMLYAFSDLLCFLLHRVVKFRRKVVRLNLQLAYPELSDKAEALLRKVSIKTSVMFL